VAATSHARYSNNVSREQVGNPELTRRLYHRRCHYCKHLRWWIVAVLIRGHAWRVRVDPSSPILHVLTLTLLFLYWRDGTPLLASNSDELVHSNHHYVAHGAHSCFLCYVNGSVRFLVRFLIEVDALYVNVNLSYRVASNALIYDTHYIVLISS